ncbi:hypothetical protein [Methylobacterium radiotolerans]|uniref:Uncharacterized protein n=1 Tax=Methylobacterium radiotolerans (strain ATCC 27329 / DSM 1819 / JCM 2831 / NBRC 15690 / NCIMB 10815 / 0-1) TaxID=426355 RepID=B1LXC9_METRJ|nr:hypothetical protein [Methylobacterium radiotolerans]ACB27250.1 hypothetical protein Mrad2831_5303 [Methylobacterium radiotolerans JCM 2831]GEM98253.1 hypothetical protein MRA01_27930 [Methylobacterium radiotolerans]
MPAPSAPAVDAYWNRTRRLFSVRRGGCVVAHVHALALSGCRFRASEAGRLRCLQQGARDVHAVVTGEPCAAPRPADAVRIGYRLDEAGFRRRDTDEIIVRADVVWLEPDGSAWALNPS